MWKKDIKAIPKRIKFTENTGYTLTVKIVEGPQQFVNRIVTVKFTAEQLDRIANWDVMFDGCKFSNIELDILPTKES